jgi:predicted ATPase
MIKRLGIHHFKAFRSLDLELRTLTVLTGPNSTGKSTVIQALLLCELASATASDFVPLNGPYGLALGEALDVLHSAADTQVIELSLESDAGIRSITLDVPDERATSLRVSRGPSSAASQGESEGRIGTYLGAERLGPRDLLEVPSPIDGLGVGHQGQFTAHLLAQAKAAPVREALRHPTTESESIGVSLIAQAQAWLSSIVRPTLLEANWLVGTSAATLRFRNPELMSEWSRPANVGFGLSYVLPVIVGALSAKPGSVFVVENPEAHLHPAGQSAVGRFLALTAASGVQVVVETHSDHILNGIRLFAGENKNGFNERSIIHYFGLYQERHSIDIGPTGALSS